MLVDTVLIVQVMYPWIYSYVLYKCSVKSCIWLQKKTNWGILLFILSVFDCPGDGTCSGQGTCDGTTGTCVCFEGFERSSGICKGKLFIIALRSFEYISLTLMYLLIFY